MGIGQADEQQSSSGARNTTLVVNGVAELQQRAVTNTTENIRTIMNDLSQGRQTRPPQTIEGFPYQLPPLHFRSQNLPQNQQEFLRTPANATQITQIFDSNTRFDPRTGRFVSDQDAMREQFDRLLGARFSEQDKAELFTHIYNLFQFQLLNEARTAVVSSYEIADEQRRNAQRDAGLAAGSTASMALAQSGVGTRDTNDYWFLKSCGDGLTEQQRQDMLRAAGTSGLFSLAAVSAASFALGVGANPAAANQASSMQIAFTRQLSDLATRNITDWNNTMKEQQANSDEQRLTRERLRRYLGTEYNEPDPVAAAAVKGQMLAGGNLANIVPRLVG